MATELTPLQRSYRAPCPGCGAPVDFRSAQSTHAVCSFCQSTVVRDGETLARIGKMAELFDDHSPLQLMAAGRWNGHGFTLVGRLQYRGPTGVWTEWNALFDDASLATLAEDNGAYVFARPESDPREMPPADRFRVGATTAIAGKTFSVASNQEVVLIAAQGELARLPSLGQPFSMVELRSADGEVLSVDYGSQPPTLARGRAVRLEELQLTGLAAASEKEDRARQFSCPNCGAPVQVQLAASKSVTCSACNSLIDLSSGVGGQLAHALQDEPVRPLIPLGSLGQLQGAAWQVIGYQHRLGHVPDDEEQEHFGWQEYLLYNRQRGFVFLVDSEEGWSVVKPTTGSPAYEEGAASASYLGTRYQLLYSYQAETTYVAGEFYWPVERGQKSWNRDFASGTGLLSMERTPREVTWSSGSKISSDSIAQAFGLEGRKELLQRSDAGPVSSAGAVGCGTIVVLVLVLLLFLFLIRACTDSSPGGGGGAWRSGGGAYGGYSSGGGHK